MESEKLKIMYGFGLLVLMAALAAAIAVGRVEEKTSFGLLPIISCLSTLAGAFAQWAFSNKGK